MSLIRRIANRYGDTMTTPVPYVSAGPSHYVFSGLSGQTESETYMRTYGTAGTIRAIVSLLAESVATPEWRLYRKQSRDGRVRYTTADQGSDQRTEVVKHAALDLWLHPNEFILRSELVEISQMYLELTGNSYWVMSRAGGSGIPLSLWPVRPDRMEPVPHAENFLAGYIYTGPSGEKVPLKVTDVIHVKYPNPLDPFNGIGVVQSVLVDIDAMKYSAEWNRNFFINSATVGGVVSVPNSLTDEEFDQLSNRWRESHQGVARAHRVAFLENGATFTPSTMSMKDMDFANLRDVSRDVLREAWGIHKAMLGNSDDVNRANAQTAEEVFGRWKVIPRLNRFRAALNEHFLPMFGAAGGGVEFDYVNPLPDDREADNAELTAKSNAYSVLVAAGADPDDAAEVVGLPAMRRAATPPAPPVATGQLEQAGESTGEPAEDAARQGVSGRAIARVRNAVSAQDLAALDAQWHAATDQVVAHYKAQALPAQRQDALEQVRSAVSSGQLAALGALTVDSAAGAALLFEAMREYARTAAAQAASEVAAQGSSSPAPVTPPDAGLQTAAQVTAALLAAGIAMSAGREALRIFAPGMSAVQVADQVEVFLESLSDAPLTTQIGGLMITAQNRARIATFEGGPAMRLYASEVLDKNTCAPCAALDGHYFGMSDDAATSAAVEAAYPTGGYVQCEGMERCRGTVVAQAAPVERPDMAALVTAGLREMWNELRANGHQAGAQ